MAQSDLLKDPNSSVEILLASEQTVAPIPRRLVVLVPEADGRDADLTHQVWSLAFELHLSVLFLGLCRDRTEEPGLRRRLVTMAASLQDEGFQAEAKVEWTRDWLGKIKTICQPGDIFVCHSEQRIGLWSRSLSKALKSTLEVSMYVLTGFYPRRSALSKFLSEFVLWVGSLAIIVGFFWAQVKLDALPKDWAHNMLLYLSVLIEVGAIWLWNSLFS